MTISKEQRYELRQMCYYTARVNGDNPARAELANGPSDDERGLVAYFRYPRDCAAYVAMRNALPALLDALEAAEHDRDALLRVVEMVYDRFDHNVSMAEFQNKWGIPDGYDLGDFLYGACSTALGSLLDTSVRAEVARLEKP